MKKPKYFLLMIALPVLILFAWFGWATYSQSRTNWIQAKVGQAMVANIENLSPHWPRIEYRGSRPGEIYYAPDIYSQAQVYDLYSHILYDLNQEATLPPLKLSRLWMSKDVGDSEDTLTVQGIVQFPSLFGIQKSMVVKSSLKIAHYPTP
jgi:hypothetical protein